MEPVNLLLRHSALIKILLFPTVHKILNVPHWPSDSEGIGVVAPCLTQQLFYKLYFLKANIMPKRKINIYYRIFRIQYLLVIDKSFRKNFATSPPPLPHRPTALRLTNPLYFYLFLTTQLLEFYLLIYMGIFVLVLSLFASLHTPR